MINQGLDPAVQGYLQDVKERARDALSESIYWFAKSYQYEFLRDVQDTLFNFDSWTDKLRQLELAKQIVNQPAGANQPVNRDPHVILAKEDFEKVGDEVFKAETMKLATALIGARQHRANSLLGGYKSCVLEWSKEPEKAWMNAMLDGLLHRGEFSFSFVEHFNKGSFSLVDARVHHVDLKEFAIETNDHNLSLTVRIMHSGRSIIASGQGTDRVHYVFTSGRTDDPISWQFVYNQSEKEKVGLPDGTPSKGISPSTTEDTIDAYAKALLDKDLPKLTEYNPGLFSDYILRIEDLDDYKKKAITKINKIVMDVFITTT